MLTQWGLCRPPELQVCYCENTAGETHVVQVELGNKLQH